MWLFCWLILAQTVSAADDAEFAFNLFSDIAPILALFGDQFAKQFMSESLTWYDHIIFAMVPLGIVTTVVGAIRVQGSPRLKAFIGYARENKAFAEIELMSSTSHEVGEIFNGKSIVRVMGRPEIRQLLIYPSESQRHRTDDAQTPKINPEKYYHTIETLKDLQHLDPNPSREPTQQLQNNSQLQGTEGQGNSRTLSSLLLRRTRVPSDEEAHANATDQVPPRNTPFKSVDSSKRFESPNLRLNISSEEYRDGKFNGSYRLKLASIVAVILQLGLIAIAGAVEYRISNKGSDLLESKKYGFPCYTIGSFLLCIGTGLCSLIIEHSTTEEIWEPDKAPTNEKIIPQLVWIQQAQRVNDQYFDGYVIFAGRKSRIIKSRRWDPKTKTTGENTDEAIATQEVQPSSTVPRSQPLNSESNIRKTGIVERDSRERLPSRIASFYKTTKRKRWEVFTSIATTSAASGFILQFMGLRGLSFPSSIAQLIAILVMAGVRAWVRKGLGKEIHYRSVATGYELDSFAASLFLNQPDLSDAEGYKKDAGGHPPEQSFQWDIMTPDIKTPDIKKPDSQKPGIDTSGIESADVYESQKGSAELIQIRKRLGELCKWRSKAFQSAQCLARCVELFMNEFFLFNGSVQEGLWDIMSTRQANDKEASVSDQFSIPLRTPRSGKGIQELWKVDDEIVEAALSLWMASIVAKKKKKDEKSGDWRTTKAGDDLRYTFRRVIGANSKNPVLQRDISWWVGDVITDQSDTSMPTGTGKVPDITIGLHGRGRDYENTENELSITEDADLPIILAQHLFTRFVWAIVGQWSLVRSLDHKLKSEHVKVEGLRAFDGFNFEKTWQQPKLSHPTLTRLVSKMESLGLGSTTDILLCIIPALSSQNLLPNDIILTCVPSIDPKQGGTNVLGCYTGILHKATLFKKKDKLRSSIIIHTMDYLYQAFHTYGDFDRLSFDLWRGLHHLTQVLISRSRKEKRFFARLSQVYRVQKKLGTLEQVFRHFNASDKDIDRLGFGELRLIKRKSFKSFALKHLHFSDDHILFNFYREPELFTLDFPRCPSAQQGYRQRVLTDDEKKDQSKEAGSRSEALDLPRAKKHDIFGWTPLHYACATGHANVLLLENRQLRAELPHFIDNYLRTPFHIAAACMDNALEKLCRAFSSEETLKEAFLAGDRIGLTTFHPIAQTGNESCIKTFFSELRHAAVRKAIATRDTFGQQPLHVAAQSGRTATVKMLMGKRSCDINAKDENGRTALHLAIKAGHTETAKMLMEENKCKTNAADEDGQTILQTAVLAGQYFIVGFLIDKDCDINAKDEDGRTALHLALSEGHASLALLLMRGNAKRKANPRLKDNRDMTTLMYAARGLLKPLEETQIESASEGVTGNRDIPSLSSASLEIFGHLIENGADTEALDSDKRTALHHAISASNEAIALYLIDQPVSEKIEAVYNATDSDSLLIRACKQIIGLGMVVTKLLARFPGLINQPDPVWDQPPISWACERGNIDAVASLLEYKPSGGNEPLDINQSTSQYFGRVPLHFAVANNKKGCLELLLKHAAVKPDIEDQFGNTPLDLAMRDSRPDLARMLVDSTYLPDCERIHQLKKFEWCSPNGFKGLVGNILNSFRSEFQLNGCLLELVQTSTVDMPTEVSDFMRKSLLDKEAQGLQYPFHRSVILGDPDIFNHLKNKADISDRAEQIDEDNWRYQDYAISLGRHGFIKVLPKQTSEFLVPRKMDWDMYHENIRVTTCNGHAKNDCSYITDVTVVKAHPTLTRACVRSDHPIPPTQGKPGCFYFEVELLENSDSRNFAIGFCGNDAQIGRMPGWFEPSWALHGDDGLLFINSGRRGLRPSDHFGEDGIWNNGDIIGVQLNMDTGVGVCTRNGQILNMGETFGKHRNSFKFGKMYPSVGFDLRTAGTKLRFAVNLEGSPAHPFKYQGDLPIKT